MRGYAYPRSNAGLGRHLGATAANVQATLPSPNVDTQRYLEGRRMFYIYQTPNIASIAAGAANTNVITFDIDSIFLWTRTAFFADIAGAVQTPSSLVVPLVTVQITDTGSGTNFFNAVIPINSIGGSGALPYVLPAPQMIQPAASLQFAFTNFSAATTYANLRIQLMGFKVYGDQAPAQLGT